MVACSGGADSVALTLLTADLAVEQGFSFVVAGVDHGLRAAASSELDRVEALAAALGRPFHRLRVEVSPRSVQASAREARYAALKALCDEIGASRLAVGHTLDDQAETILAGMVRGKRPEAWGMLPRRADGVIRPLLRCRRGALRDFVRRRGVDWIEDPSNDDPRFERVRVRRLLPSLEVIDPRAVEHLAVAAEEVRAARRLVRAHGARALARASVDGASADGELAPTGGLSRGESEADASAEGPERAVLQLAPLLAAPKVVRREALRAWLAKLDDPARVRHLDALDRLVTTQKGQLLLSRGRALRIVDGALVLGRGPSRTRSQRGGPTSR